jgi:monoamine oxidase
VLTLPFTALRDVQLAASLQLPASKRQAIDLLGYGHNAKMMVGFDGPHWRGLGSKGASYSDLTNHQATWETNWTAATNGRAVLTAYSGGARGARLDPSRLQTEVARFLGDLDRVFPGTKAQATQGAAGYVAHLESWPRNPYTKGSYTCYRPGQWRFWSTEGVRERNIHFCGEHCSVDFQGWMEGAAETGAMVAGEILEDLGATFSPYLSQLLRLKHQFDQPYDYEAKSDQPQANLTILSRLGQVPVAHAEFVATSLNASDTR